MIEDIQNLLRNATVETTPAAAVKVERFADHVPEGTTIYVTFLPGSDFGETLKVVRRLKDEGMHAVPHLAARSIRNRDALAEMLAALEKLGASGEVLIIGGGVDKPVGAFDSTIALMETDLLQQHGVRKVGIAGHPEGSPDISPAAVDAALQAKSAYGKKHGLEIYIATQFCFEAKPIIAWHDRLQAMGLDLPIHLGLPGPATIKNLLRFAQISGIGNSMRLIKKEAMHVTRLLTQRAPDELLVELAKFQAGTPDQLIRCCHLYPFGGFAKTAAWLGTVQRGEIILEKNGFRLREA